MNLTNLKNIYKANELILVSKSRSDINKNMLHSVKFHSGKKIYFFSSKDGKKEIAFTLRDNNINNIYENALSVHSLSLILGDDSEWGDTKGKECMAYGVFFKYDIELNKLLIITSLVGLPPLFLYKGNGYSILTTDIYLISCIPEINIRFSPKGIMDLFYTGHPINHRTLFKECNSVPSGCKIEFANDGEFSISSNWNKPIVSPMPDWTSFTELQINSFMHSIMNVDLQGAFLSLTGGLDTRTILAGLIKENTLIPAYTMSGTRRSLDARTAEKLCQAYGIKHKIIVLDDAFIRNLPYLSEEAARLSGGLSGIEQASEIYYFKNIDNSCQKRVSGNLGNQIGRGGTEGSSLMKANTCILNDNVVNGEYNNASSHWYNQAETVNDRLDISFLIKSEIPFSSVGNFCIGNHFTIQMSPYASKKLVEASFRMPLSYETKKPISITKLRINDLRHRFIGEPEARSFQRKLINHVGGYVARCPINWGWRAQGGVSIFGLAMGALTFVDALAHSKKLDNGFVGNVLKKINISGLNDFRENKIWVNTILKDFIHDTLISNDVKQSGLFNNSLILNILDEHYSFKKDHYKELSCAMNMALAIKIFNAVV